LTLPTSRRINEVSVRKDAPPESRPRASPQERVVIAGGRPASPDRHGAHRKARPFSY